MGILHVPIDDRRADGHPLWPRQQGRAFGPILRACLDAVALPAGTGPSPADRLQAIGRQLRGLAGLPLAELGATVSNHLVNQDAARLRALHQQLERHADSSTPWVRDCRAMLEDHLADLLEPTGLAARELVPLGEARAAELTRTLIASFGALLEAWPALLAAGRQLQNDGQGLFRNLT